MLSRSLQRRGQINRQSPRPLHFNRGVPSSESHHILHLRARARFEQCTDGMRTQSRRSVAEGEPYAARHTSSLCPRLAYVQGRLDGIHEESSPGTRRRKTHSLRVGKAFTLNDLRMSARKKM
jgi:hypothetical protein